MEDNLVIAAATREAVPTAVGAEVLMVAAEAAGNFRQHAQ